MKRRFLVLLLVAVMLISVLGVAALAQEPASVYEQSCYLHGDINNDGKIDSQDAIHTLFHAIPMFQEQYPIDQDCDFNKDTLINSKDAIHLLYAADPDHAEEYPLDGTIHRYFEPVWEWEADTEDATAKVTLNCGCGEAHVITDISITTGHLEEAGCVTAGSKEYVGRFTCNGQFYVGTYTVELPAGEGHVFDEAASCEEAVKCDFCDVEKPAKGHDWVLNEEASTAATCYEVGKQVWECACGATNELELSMVDHQYVAVDSVLVAGTTCEYKEQFKCQVSDCGHVMDGEYFFKHQYTVTLTGEADCTNHGEKTYTCGLCNDSYTEPVAPNGIHKWNAGVEANGIITYTCESCNGTQTAVAVQNDQAVSKETLKDTDKVTLEGGASVSLDDATVEALSGDVKLSVEEADLSGVTIDAEKLAQIGNNKVYDFKLSDSTGNKSEFGGEITVSLPYVLGEGEDIDSIDVWYIADNGELKRMEGTYSNGYVTFTTTHFSYYTVTRLTAAERCERYGHINVTSQSQATCTQDGYTLNVCQRCGHSEKTDVVGKTGHNYQDTQNSKPAGCTEDGLKEQECQNCHDVQSQVLPATGHTMVKDEEQSYGATCTATGSEYYACSNSNCDFYYDVEISQKPHEYVSEEVVAPSCDSKGYERFGCKTCDKEVIRNEKAALGHDYAPAKNGWTWSEDHKTASLKLVCGNNSSHEKVISATVTEKTENSVCLGGAVTYTATVSFNMNTYTDIVTATEEGKGHVPSNRWVIENDRHYRICVVCGENADVGAHTYGEKTVTKAPTCVESGMATQACTVCGHEKVTVIDATGAHSYANGVCSVCGVAETGCKHVPNQKTVYDLSQYGACGGEIVLRSCSCGEVVQMEGQSVYCQWGDSKRTEEVRPDGTVMSVTTKTCQICGLQWTYKDYSIDDKEKCEATWYEIDQMSIGGTQIYNVEFEYWVQSHPMHVEGKTVNLKDYGLCGGVLSVRECYCGKAYSSYQEDGEGGCNWVYDGTINAEKCSVCGATYTWSAKEQENGCEYIVTANRTYSLNGKTVYVDGLQQIYSNHEYEVDSIELMGKTCEDGVKIIQSCTKCTETDEYVTVSHISVNEQVIDLSGYDMCCDKLVITTCPCSEARKDFYIEGDSHQWSYDYWLEDRISATCRTCGTKWTQENKVGEKDADCHAMVTEKHTWTDVNGNQIKAERTGETDLHEFTVSAKLKGQTCEDGVTATYTCSDCGYVKVENYNDHRNVIGGVYDLSDYGGCESVVEWQACACQMHAYWGWNEHSCEFYHVTGDENSETMKCSKCGITRREVHEEMGRIDSCHYKVRETYSFSKDGVELFAFSFTPVVESHRIISELTLHEGATTCAEGYHIKSTCLACGEVVGEHDSYSEYHETYPVKWETISQGQLCGDLYQVTYRCACGEEEYTTNQRTNGQCSYVHQGYVNGYEVYHCNKCGVTQKMRGFQEAIDGETCRYWMITNYVFTKDGVTIAACDIRRAYTEHQYEHTFQLNGTSCEDGFTATGVCALCGVTETWTYEGHDYHESMAVEYVDLASYGACGGTMVYYSCACGQETRVEHYDMSCRMNHSYSNETDLNGVHHQYTTDTCRKCGLEITQESYNVKGENCTMEEHTVKTYRLGDKLNKTFNTVYSWESHDAEPYAVSLMEGAQTCEDGVYVYERCKDCGREFQSHGSSHYRVAVSTEDLSAYGSVCGGKLELTQCACGEHIGYEFSEDTKCDLHERQIGHWIEGVLDNYQYTTEGGVGVWSYSYMYVCPVTDPQCSLTIRMSRYWLKEGCEAVQYEIWQLGYDEETDTCQKELKIATGERVGYHSYKNTQTEEHPTDNTRVVVDSYVCPDCQSTYTEKYTYVDEIQTKYEVSAVNTLNNGENKQMEETEEYGLVHEGYSFLTSRRYSRVNADGTTFWRNYTYSYDPTDYCWRTVTWSDSEGNGHTYEEQSHHTEWEYETVKESTCSQHGEYIDRYVCVICDTITQENTYTNEPTAHYWEWNDELHTFVCWRCGLESANASSGAIVLEDLTDAYGKGTNYVVGYWNRNEVGINPYVSVILESVAEGENDELVLTGINIQELTVVNDGVRALAFNKAEAYAKAAEAIANAGYTGSYALRISFVPIGIGNELDYAVTFDSQMAE